MSTDRSTLELCNEYAHQPQLSRHDNEDLAAAGMSSEAEYDTFMTLPNYANQQKEPRLINL
jgi:hypothetical protein